MSDPSIRPDPDRPTEAVTVTGQDGRNIRIYKEAADPEHRFAADRLAADRFDNPPSSYDTEKARVDASFPDAPTTTDSRVRQTQSRAHSAKPRDRSGEIER